MSWNFPRLGLEDFVSEDLNDVRQASELTTAALRLQPRKFAAYELDELANAYDDALDELLNVAPNLEQLLLSGGHLWRSGVNASWDEAAAELGFVDSAIRAVTWQMNVRNLSWNEDVDYVIKYNLYMVISEQVFAVCINSDNQQSFRSSTKLSIQSCYEQLLAANQ